MKIKNIFFLNFFFVVSLTYAQEGKVRLIKYTNKDCTKSDKVIRDSIKKITDIVKADEYLREVCKLTNSSVYKLFCPDCVGKTIIEYPTIIYPKIKGGLFTLSTKGDNKINNLLQLRKTLVDSLTVMENLTFDISSMSINDLKKAKTLYFTDEKTNTIIYPKYDNNLSRFIIDKSLFSVKDSTSVSVISAYLDGKSTKYLPNKFEISFVSENIKLQLIEEVKNLLVNDRSIFDDSTGLEYVLTFLSFNYSNVDVQSVSSWLNKIISENEK